MTRIVVDAMGSDDFPVPDVVGAVRPHVNMEWKLSLSETKQKSDPCLQRKIPAISPSELFMHLKC